MIAFDHGKVLVQLWQAEKHSLETMKILQQTGKLLRDMPPDSYLWTGTEEELKAVLKQITEMQFSAHDPQQPHRL